jgi:hypothetical protein
MITVVISTGVDGIGVPIIVGDRGLTSWENPKTGGSVTDPDLARIRGIVVLKSTLRIVEWDQGSRWSAMLSPSLEPP